jgi:ligand-binding sensor domain-containing protein
MGLSQSNVNCIFQDSKGFLWLGTKDGLNRYDGYSFRIYQNTPADSNSISDNYITALAEDKSGNIWAGTLGGKLNRLNNSTQQIKVYDLLIDPLFNENNSERPEALPCYSNFSNRTITSIICDREGLIYAGTWGNGIFRYDPNTKSFSKHFFFLEDINSVSSNNILALAQDNTGTIWIGTLGGGLNKLEIKKEKGTGKEEFLFIKNPDGIIVNDNISSLLVNNDNLWIGSFNGLYKLDIAAGTIRNISSEIHYSLLRTPSFGEKITGLSIDHLGNIWMGTFGAGLREYDTLSKNFYSYVNNPDDQNTIDDNDVISVFVDATDQIWAGTFSGYGVNKLNPQKFRFNYYSAQPNLKNKLSDKIINSIAGELDGNIWIGTYKGGLNKYNRTTRSFKVFRFNPSDPFSISSNYITSVFTGNKNEVWAGTFDKGLNLLDNPSGNFLRFLHDPSDNKSISSNQVTSIAGDRDGNVWIGTFSSGLNKIIKENNNFRFKRYKKNELYSGGLPDDGIKGLYTDINGNLWITVAGGYLLKYDYRNDDFITYRLNISPGRSAEIISFCDKGDFIWIGTNGEGLLKFIKKNGQFIPEDCYYLNGRAVYGILGDNWGYLWLSTDNGILRYWTNIHSIVSFNLNDGLQSLRFTNGAYYKTKDGEMFFGGINGFNSFYPDSFRSHGFFQKPGITSFKILNKEVPLESNVISLGYSENSMSIEFSSFDFADPLKNQYAYKLDGYDNVWHNTTGTYRTAVYNNLPPGKYTFKLTGSGFLGDSFIPNELKIIIDSPFYQKWWFILIVIFIVGGIICYIVWTRINQYLSVQKLKEKLAADLHDSIGSGLTEISLLSAVARDYSEADTGMQKAKLKAIGDRAGELIDNMSDIVWLVNPKNKSLKDLILRLKDSYSTLCSSIGISFKLMNIEQLDESGIIMEKRQNIYLIFKEGINNSIKYSGCRNITLSVESDNRNFIITLKDDGSGFDMKNKNPGNGLNNMKKRAQESDMQLKLESSEGQGTLICLKGKLK